MSDHKHDLRIKIVHPSMGECLARTRHLSCKGVYVQHLRFIDL
ncbi:hypothetical protein [Pseudomonas agarici]|nr:hypothetical protein SAMN05216604_104171 [Pseudomonas agarici]